MTDAERFRWSHHGTGPSSPGRHTRCGCLVLKAQPFSPTQVGQLSFYITAIERQLRRDGDEPTIGVLLVPDTNRLVVEYALAALTTPMTVASYTYTQLPADVQATLPAADDLAPIINQASHKPG